MVVSSKTTASSTPGRLPSTSAVSPARAVAAFATTARARAPSAPLLGFRRSSRLEAQDHRQPATVLPALPPRAGFEHSFAAEHVRKARGRQARPNAYPLGSWLGPSASRRLLQPEQSTSTTTGSPDPRSASSAQRAQLALGWEETSGWVWRHPPHRPPAPGGATRRFHLGEPCGSTRLDAGRDRGLIRRVVLHQPRSHGPGAGQLSPPSASRLASRVCYVIGTRSAGHARKRARDESFAPTRSARTPHVARSRRSRWRVCCWSDNRRQPAEAIWNGRPPTIPPRRPCPHEWTRERRTRVAPGAPAFAGCAGPRAASPETPRRGSRSAAPEVPSIEKPPNSRDQAFAWFRASDGALSTDCHQPVENARRRCPSRQDPRSDPAALTGCRRCELGLRSRRSSRGSPNGAGGTGFDPRPRCHRRIDPQVLPWRTARGDGTDP